MFKYIKKKLKEWNMYNNPYYHWWLARDVFMRPRWHLYHIGKTTWFYGLPIVHDYYNPIIDFKLSGLGYKLKYNEPRHEWNPYFAITLFRRFQIIFMLSYYDDSDPETMCRNDATWEAMLEYIFDETPICDLIKNHSWKSFRNKDEIETITIIRNLK